MSRNLNFGLRSWLSYTSKSSKITRQWPLWKAESQGLRFDSGRPNTRYFASNPPRFKLPETESPFRVSHIVTALLVLGVGATAFGLYDFYQTLTKWPPEVRDDLRSGLRAKARKDLKLSQRYLNRAWETIKTLPNEALAPEPYMKTSGVAIALAEVLEADNRPLEAYAIYEEALQLARPSLKVDPSSTDKPEAPETKAQTPAVLNLRERKCTVAIALKLGEIAEQHDLPAADEEKWLSYAVSEVMRILQEDHTNAGSPAPKAKDNEDNIMDLPLPGWVSLSKTEMATPMERLASFYRRQGKYEYVMTLYQTALQILLMSEPSRPPTIEDQCRAAMVMNNMSETVVHRSSAKELEKETAALEAASKMAHHAIVNSKKYLERAQSSNCLQEAGLCGRTFLFAAYNLAAINSLLGKEKSQAEDESRLVEAFDFLGRNFKDEMTDPDVQEVLRAWREYRRKLDRIQTTIEK
ncbi:hypothetical protein SCHPADRAFT_865317 [Schizopora paradoxa]|uniref:TPR-like protein n=1 Tax=Schizopora paradoxa TaxID=27342 RepID=A0A0H2S679_9AGAM|nr:hypothetical protein SCHPADRAFT_865317 [Schizopora paradoxa]